MKKRLVFASPEIAITILFATVNSWYFYFLVNVAALPPILAGGAFAFGRIVDAIFDPIVGRWSDRRSSKHGRKRTILYALGPTAMAFALIWSLPATVEGPWLKTFVAALSFALFAFGYTLITVPRMAMLPQYEADYHGRTAQIAVDMVFIFLSLAFAVAGVPALISLIDGSTELSATAAAAWWPAAAGLAGIACLAYLPFLVFVPDQTAAHPSQSADRLLGDLRATLRVPRFRLTVAVFFLSVVSLVSIQSMLPFFLESFVGVPKNRQAPVLATVFAISVLSLPLWVALGRRIGKVRGLMAGIAVYVIFLFLTALIGRGTGVGAHLIVSAVFAGASITALSVFPWAMVPDAVDLYRTATGRAHQGLCVSVFTFTNKLASTTAVMLNGVILSLSGHVAGQAVQSEQTIWAILAATVALPFLFAVFCFL
ncbi:MFS transporter, partial [uncultured Nitratireductor sp.]|uniref:MFS transporter n=1 Tax=uncultured Nitratireductor sp. TaxID=520953 RepID=UPI0025ECCBE7